MSGAHGRAAPVVGRLAPSPTGLLHLGHARTFLLAWWSARSQGGRVLLRIEDLDGGRSRPHFADASRRDLEWLGLDWDGEPRVQSSHASRFETAMQTLLDAGAAYPCVCTRADLRTLATAPHAGDSEPRYLGTCRGRFRTLSDAESESGRPAGVRLMVPEGVVTLQDRVFGEYRADVAAEVGDFLIARRGGSAAYQLAVVVDDAADGVTEVVRGADLLPSAARQWHVQRALGLPQPVWAHVPLVVDDTGRRLAKRADDLSLAALRERGVDPGRVVGFVARSAGMDVSERVTAREVVGEFGFEKLPREEVRVGGDVARVLGGVGR
jgi:glutamyl-tRNA synthetase